MKGLITNWLPVIVWIGGIYWGSSQPVLPEPLSSSSWQGLLLRKTVHFVEYAVLATLLWRALVNTSPSQIEAKQGESKNPSAATLWSRRWVLPQAFVIALLYAVFDEWHQSFVPNRAGRLLDVATDIVGVVTALGLIWWRFAWK